jgi:hypothetical protein
VPYSLVYSADDDTRDHLEEVGNRWVLLTHDGCVGIGAGKLPMHCQEAKLAVVVYGQP